MARRKLYLWVAFFVVLIAVEAAFVWAEGNGNGNGNSGHGNGNGNLGNGNGNGNSGDGNGNGNGGSGNGNGNSGSGNGNGNTGDNIADGSNGNGSGNNGNGNGNGNNGSGNGNGNGNGDDGKGNNGKGDDDNGNGNGNSNGSGNGNGNNGSGNGNGNGNNGNGKGEGNNGNGKGEGNNGKGDGEGNNGKENGEGNNVKGDGEGNNGKGDGEGNNGKGKGDGNNGNGKGEGNNGKGNGEGNTGNGNGNGNNGSGNGNDKGNGNGNGNSGNGNGNKYDSTTDYDELTPSESGQQRARCKASGNCQYKNLTCPSQCPEKKPKENKNSKGCFIDCSTKCEATCMSRKPNCNGYGSLCYDPRFIGADGVVFYFHGSKGGNFAIVSDENFQINAHFIGNRPQGRTRDFTWVQALSIMFETHTLVIAAKRVSHWDHKVDALLVRWDSESVSIPTDGDAEWRTNGEEREVLVERTDNTNNVRVKVAGLVEIHIKVRPIGKEESRVHNYRLPAYDVFAHLETQFRFSNLSDLVEGVLGKTYRPDYVSPVKLGVAMPTMGGEAKYQTPSLISPRCMACRFQRPSMPASDGVAQY